MPTKTVSIKDAKNKLTALARLVERGEKVIVTRNGKPIFDLIPHRKRGGLKLDAIEEFKRKHRLKSIFASVAANFDEPLPEDFLLHPFKR
jgi:prevent-host-death family protein